MAPLDFPTSPTVGDTYIFEQRAWRYNGRGWAAYSSPTNTINNLTVSGSLGLTTSNINVSGSISFPDSNPYSTFIGAAPATVNRYIVFPDRSGPVALVTSGIGQLVYSTGVLNEGLPTLTTDGTNLTLSGRFIVSVNGAFSNPPVSLTGTWASGGGTTNTKPALLIEPTGTTSTNWSNGGTGLGINAPSGFAGSLFDCQVAGSSKFEVFTTGLRYYNVSGTNYERAKFAWESNALRIGTEKAGSGTARVLELQTDGTTQVSIAINGKTSFAQDVSIATGKTYQVNGVPVVGARATGWTAATGTATRTAFDTTTVTTSELAERVKALIDSLITHGLIGT